MLDWLLAAILFGAPRVLPYVAIVAAFLAGATMLWWAIETVERSF